MADILAALFDSAGPPPFARATALALCVGSLCDEFQFARQRKSWKLWLGKRFSVSHRPNIDALRLLRLAAFAIGLPLAETMAQQTASTPEPQRREIWRAELPGGTYIVLLSAVSCVSLHEYVVDSAARVLEVNIATSGSELARFYHIEPYPPKPPSAAGQRAVDSIENKAKQLSAGLETGDLRGKVLKNYPTTTHAHTVEYRLVDRESVGKLFKSIEDSWLNGRSGSFKP
jgi:hypothetical protein